MKCRLATVVTLILAVGLLGTAGWAALTPGKLVTRGPSIPADIAAAATAYTDALVKGDSQKGWRLLSSASRKETDVVAWHRAFEHRSATRTPPAVALLRALASLEPAPTVGDVLLKPDEALVLVKANVPITKTLVLVKEKDGWKVDLKATDEINSKEAASDFLAAVKEDASITQGRSRYLPREGSLSLLKVMLEPQVKKYRPREAEIEGNRAIVTMAAEVPLNLVLKAARSGPGWMVDISKPVLPIDVTSKDPLKEAAEYAERSECEAKLRQLVRGIQMYAASSNNMLPDPDHWMDQIRPYLPAGFDAHCPMDKEPGISYAYNANLRGKRIREVANPSLVPMLYESTLHTRNPADTGQSWATGRHAAGNMVAFVDGSIRPAPNRLSFDVSTAKNQGRGRAKAFVPRRPR